MSAYSCFRIINGCILKIYRPRVYHTKSGSKYMKKACWFCIQDCKEVLDEQWAKINDPNGVLHLQFINLYLAVLQQGRIAAGASPVESFQIFVTDYVQFWNADNPDCDKAQWGWWCSWGGKCAYMTQALRTEMNDMVVGSAYSLLILQS